MTPRHRATILFLLRNHAAQQRFEHGPMVERPGGIELTPSEMDAWADEIEAEHDWGARTRAACDRYEAALPNNSTDGWLDT